MTATPLPTMLEFFHVGLHRPGELPLRAAHATRPPDAGFLRGDPNVQAIRLSGLPAGSWCHSTSWRTERGMLILTFLTLSEGTPTAEHDEDLVYVDNAATARSRRSQVLAHAIGHLHYLAEKHDEVRDLVDRLGLQASFGFRPTRAGYLSDDQPTTEP